MKPRLLDLFCKEGGAGEGYARAGFDVIGVDHVEQSRYPHRFVLGDALDVVRRYGHHFDAIHASPPCQGYLNLGGVNRARGRDHDHPDLIAATRELLLETGKPYVIENVEDARKELRDPVRLCGSSFGLPIRRHRLFETNFPVLVPSCDHSWQIEKKYWTGWRPNGEKRLATVVQIYGNAGGKHEWPAAMGIDWMSDDGLVEAVPPAYTHHIGEFLLIEVRTRRMAAA